MKVLQNILGGISLRNKKRNTDIITEFQEKDVVDNSKKKMKEQTRKEKPGRNMQKPKTIW